MGFDPPTSSDSQAYDPVQDADRVELTGTAVVSGTVDQGAAGLSAWLVSINGVPHVVLDSGSVVVSAVAGTVTVDGSGHTQPVSGTVTATGPLTDTQLRATPVPVSGTVTASGPLTDTQLRATAVPVSLSAGAAVIGHVIVDSATIAALTDGSQRVGGTVLVDGSAVTQPVSGTFFQATQPVSAASLPLPSGAATDATLDLVRVAVRNAEFDAWLRFDETRWS